MNSESSWGKWVLAAGLAIALFWVWGPRWRTYPQVTSEASLRLVRKLYTACNVQNPRYLVEVETDLGKAPLSESERRSFESILELAKKGDWKSAKNQSFVFAQDQLRWGAQ